MRLYFACSVTCGLSFALPIRIFVPVLLPFSRITQHSAFLSYTLYESCTYWRVARVDIADVIFELVEGVWVIVYEKAERFTER
jgi:hypothetical protein